MLEVVSCEKAIEIIKENFEKKAVIEEVGVNKISGRTLGEDIYSSECIPAFDRSTVDGYAVIAADTYGAGENMPSMLTVKGEILMGEEAAFTLNRGECVKISTGGMLPYGADAVIMVENTDEGFDGLCLCLKSLSPYENVTRKGDDVKTGEAVLKKGTRLSSSAAGVLCALGKEYVQCVKKPKIGIISTGDEIVPVGERPEIGQVRDVNSFLLSSLIEENGCEVIHYGIVKDNKDDIAGVFGRALNECDTVLLSGGSSKGERDAAAEIISARGELLFHGLAMKPGKPTILGKCDKKAVFGLPGHPAAAYFVALRLVLPALYHIFGITNGIKKYVYKSGTDIPSNNGREEVVSVKISDGKFYPLFGKSGLVSLLSESDGFIIIDRNREGIFLGEETEVYLTR